MSKLKTNLKMRSLAVACQIGLLTTASLLAAPASAKGEVNLYTTREPKLIQPLLDAFTEKSGIKVNTVFVKDGLLERVKAEGKQSPADVFMVVDIGNLTDLVEAGVTQSIESETLTSVLPAHLRGKDNQWFTLSLRDRVLYVDKDIALDSFSYEDLADPKWKGKVCIRSGQHPYNIALIAAMIAHNGAEATESWLRSVKANLARSAAGGDRNVARDILGGICDIGIANNYYVGHMKNAEPGSDDRKWGDAIKVVRPYFANSTNKGTHVNISGAAIAKNAPNRENGVQMLEYLVSAPAQKIYSRVNYEYPILPNIELDPVMQEMGDVVADALPMEDIAKHRKQASELVEKVGFDQ